MGLQVSPGQLESFIGTFYRTNCKNPRSRPEGLGTPTVLRLVITKGTLQIGMDDHQIEVNIPEVEQVDDETYEGFTRIITDQLVDLLQAPQLRANIHDAMGRDGVIAYFNGATLVVNPLTASVGETDQFPTA